MDAPNTTADELRTTGALEWDAPTVTLLNLTTKEVRLEKERMRKQWKRAEGRRDRVKSLRAHARNTDSGVEAKGTRFVFKGRRRQSFDARPLAPIGHRKLINSLKGRLARTSWDDLKCIEEILNAYDGGAFDDLMTIAQDHADGLYNDDVTADDVRTTGAAD